MILAPKSSHVGIWNEGGSSVGSEVGGRLGEIFAAEGGVDTYISVLSSGSRERASLFPLPACLPASSAASRSQGEFCSSFGLFCSIDNMDQGLVGW